MAEQQTVGGDVYRVENQGKTDFVGKLSPTQVYRIPAGGQSIVPREAVWLWLGRPWLVDLPDKGHLDRKDELARLHTLYGAHCKDENTGMVEDELWELNKPRLAVFDMVGGSIRTVIDDPKGIYVTPVVETQSEKDLLSETVEKLRRELAAMQGRLNGLERGEAQPDEEVPEDAPRAVPVGPRRGRESS